MSVNAGAGQGGVGRGPVWTAGVSWDPSARQEVEPDTLFLLDPQAEQAAGYTPGHDGFLFGRGYAHDTPWTLVAVVAGKYRSGLRLVPPVDAVGTHGPLWMPLRHLINPGEWTLECWLSCDADWSAVAMEHPVHLGGARPAWLGLDLVAGKISLYYGTTTLQYTCPPGSFAANTFYSVAATYAQSTRLLSLYAGGALVRQAAGVAPIGALSEAADMDGLHLHGYVNGSPSGGHCTLSDLRLSGSARTPGAPQWVSDVQTVRVDARSAVGAQVNARLPAVVFGGGAGGADPAAQGASAGAPAYYTSWGAPREAGVVRVQRADHFLEATPIASGAPTGTCPDLGHSGLYSYNWACFTDIVCAKVQAAGQGLHLSLDFTPSLLGGGNSPQPPPNTWSHLADSACKGPPTSYSAFATICSDFVWHIYWDLGLHDLTVGLWNEPNDSFYWGGTLGDPSLAPGALPAGTYLGLYAAVAPAVKAVSPAIPIGGPEVSSLNTTWIRGLIQFCAQHALPLDFVSYHDYSGDATALAGARSAVDGWLIQYGLPSGLPLIVGEFNWNLANISWYPFAYNNPDPSNAWWHNDWAAAYLAHSLLAAQAAGNVTLCYTFAGSKEDGQPSGNINALGLVTKDHAWAPFNVYRQWALLAQAPQVCVSQVSGGRALGALASTDSTSAPTTLRVLLVQNRYRKALGDTLVAVALAGFTAQSYTQYTVDDAHANYFDTGGASVDLSVTAQGTFGAGATPTAANPLYVSMRPRSSTLLVFQ